MKTYKYLATLASLAIFASSAQAALVGHYEFEETSGTTLVDTTGTLDGALQGSGNLNVTGQFGSGYEPGAGAGDYGQLSNGVSTFNFGGNNARTISLWFNTPNFNSGDPDDQYRMIGMGDGAGASFDITAENNANSGNVNRVGLRYGNGNIFFDADNSGTAFATDTWYHIAVVYDGTNMDLETASASDGIGLNFYVNGTLVNIAGGNGNNGTQELATSLTDIALGAKFDGSISSGASSGYPGLLDEVRFYDSALSSSEVAALAVIPEPSAFGLLAGIFGFAWVMLRRR